MKCPEHLGGVTTCGLCKRVWCAECDPGPSALCHWCHGRGHSTAELVDPNNPERWWSVGDEVNVHWNGAQRWGDGTIAAIGATGVTIDWADNSGSSTVSLTTLNKQAVRSRQADQDLPPVPKFTDTEDADRFLEELT